MAMVCSCHVVSERRIRRAIDQGACTVSQVTDQCGAGGSCLSCHDVIEELLDARDARAGLVGFATTPVHVRIA